MLFQMCYGPEIKSIYEVIRRYPGCTREDLRAKFQYRPEGDISSLLEGVVIFLTDLELIASQDGKLRTNGEQWDVLDVFQRLNKISGQEEADSLNHVFATLYSELFVKPNQLFVRNMHYRINQRFSKTLVGQEKINAWKRIMEYFGLGFRAYSGFYALPQQRLMEKLIRRSGVWEGPIQAYCLKHIHPIIPCVHEGKVFSGFIFGLAFMHKRGLIQLTKKQDLPYNSFGPHNEWNWIRIEEVGQ